VTALDRVIRRAPPWAVSFSLAAVLVVVALLKYGIGSFPQWVTLYDIGTNWMDPRAGAHLDARNDYLLSNSLAAVVGGVTGLVRSRESYGTVMLVLTFAAIIWPFAMPRVRQSRALALLVFVTLLGGPVLAVLMIWVGGYDPLTVIAASLIGLGRSRWVRVAGWALFGLNHYSMAAIAFAIFVVAWTAGSRMSTTRARVTEIAWYAAGVIAGAGASLALIALWGGASTRTSATAMPIRGEGFWSHYVTMLPWIALSTLGVGWLLFVHLGLRGDRRAWLALGSAAGAVLVVPFVGYDATRDVALALLPTLFMAVAATERDRGRTLPPSILLAYAAAAVALPTALVFGWQVSWVGWAVGG
jgi:hypothetical protein